MKYTQYDNFHQFQKPSILVDRNFSAKVLEALL